MAACGGTAPAEPALERATSRGGLAGRRLMRPLGRALHKRMMPGLSARERAALRELRDTYCNEAFDPASDETDRQLRDIWGTAFPSEPITDTEPGEHWKRLGFQSATPRTDVRAGRLALDQLHYLATRHPQLLQRLAQEAEGLGYPFACSCFNVTQILAQFFGLYRMQAVMPVAGAGKATAEQRKSFARLCGRAPEGPRFVLDELFCSLVELLHKTWRQMHGDGGLNLMDFPLVLRKVHLANAAFWQWQHGDTADFRRLLDEAQPAHGSAPNPGLGAVVLEAATEAAGHVQAAWRRAGSGAAARDELPPAEAMRGSEVELAWMPPRLRLPEGEEAGQRSPGAVVKTAEDLDLDAVFTELGIDDEVPEVGEGPTPADLNAVLEGLGNAAQSPDGAASRASHAEATR